MRGARAWAALALGACAAILTAGCGNSIQPAGGVVGSGFRTIHYASFGISLRAPTSWSTTTGQGPLIATFSSGSSVVALWRFPRDAGPPQVPVALRRARRKLIRKARGRDPKLDVIRTNITRVAGAPAVEIDAIERINGRQRRVRSTHVFAPRAEVVLDEYAPPGAFHSVDHAVFSPLRHSLLLSGTSTA
jgi:hypothetical protein